MLTTAWSIEEALHHVVSYVLSLSLPSTEFSSITVSYIWNDTWKTWHRKYAKTRCKNAHIHKPCVNKTNSMWVIRFSTRHCTMKVIQSSKGSQKLCYTGYIYKIVFTRWGDQLRDLSSVHVLLYKGAVMLSLEIKYPVLVTEHNHGQHQMLFKQLQRC